MPSRSLSALHGLVFSDFSSESESPSRSESGDRPVGTPLMQSPVWAGGFLPAATGPMTGERRRGVALRAKRRASTRRLKRVGTDLPPLRLRNGSSLAGTTKVSLVDVALSTGANTARARARWKTTQLRFLPGMKFLPRMVSVSPTPRCSGETATTLGGVAALATPVASGTAHAAAQARARAERSTDIERCGVLRTLGGRP